MRFLDILNRTLYDNVQRMQTDKNLTLSLVDYVAGGVKLSGQHESMIAVRENGAVLTGHMVAPRGAGGCGWDRVFQPHGTTKTFAEMEATTKNAISMRRVALDQEE